MQSPRIEWVAGIGYLALIDYVRSRGDADGDTLSEVTRDLVKRHPAGDHLFAAGLAVGALVLHRHICKET